MKWLYLSTLAIWGLVPLAVVIVAFAFPPLLIEQPRFMAVLPVLWALSCVILFFLMLRGDEDSSMHAMYSLMGLTCTFVLGLPAIAFSTIPLFGSPADFLQSINPVGNQVVLDSPKERSGLRTLHLIGVDISRSFIKDGNDPRIDQVLSVLDSVFIDDNNSPASKLLEANDVLQIYVFASDVSPVANNKDAGTGRLTLRGAALQGLRKRLASPEQVLDRNSTDLLKFLDIMQQEVRQNEKDFEKFNLFLFSDLIQSQEGVASIDVEGKLQPFGNTIRRKSVESFAFWARSYEDKGRESKNARNEVARYLRSDLEKYWLEFVLEDYASAMPEEKIVMPVSLYGEEVRTETLYLKYLPDPGWQALGSTLLLPKSEETNILFFGLKRARDQSSVRIKFAKNTSDDFALGFNEYEQYARYERKAGEQNPLVVELAGQPDSVRDAHCELLIAVPSESIIYRVPLVILPTMREDAVWVLKLVIGILHLLPLLIALQIYRSRFGVKKGKTE